MTEIDDIGNGGDQSRVDVRAHSTSLQQSSVPGYDVGAPVPGNDPDPSTDGSLFIPEEDPFNQENAISQSAQAEPIPATTVQATAQEHTDDSVPSEVEGLKAMFPDFDAETLLSVLGSVGGNQERAADVLLGMSDPSYQPQHQAEPSQTELDEQLARRLAYEDQQRQQQYQPRWQPNNQYGVDPRQRPFGDYASQQTHQNSQGAHYDNARSQWENQQSGASGRDTMAEVQEQFSKIAESGKRTFSSFVTKVKAKMQEFDQSHNSAPNSQSQISWGSGPVGSSNVQSIPDEGHFSLPSAHQEYDVAPSMGSNTAIPQTGTGTRFESVSAPIPPAERIPPRPPSAGPPPAGNVDPVKIGMLPKRVSVLGTTPPQSNARRDDDEELDYVENPFDDERK